MSFTFRHLKPEDPYYANWLDLQKRQRWFWLALPGFVLSTIILGLVSSVVFKKEGFPWFALPGLLLLIGTRLYQVRWACPRCEQAFYMRSTHYWPFANSCLHCGLSEFAANAAE